MRGGVVHIFAKKMDAIGKDPKLNDLVEGLNRNPKTVCDIAWIGNIYGILYKGSIPDLKNNFLLSE